MNALLGVAGIILGLAAIIIIVRHHVAYFHGARPYSFGAFLETSGWIVLLLVALGALYVGANFR